MQIGDRHINLSEYGNELRHRVHNGTFKPFSTAAPSTIQAELALRQALDRCENSAADHILHIGLSSMMSAEFRNVNDAITHLPQEAQERITVHDSGYLGCDSLLTREALRCAEKGMDVDEIMARVKYVEDRVFNVFILSSATKKNLAQWGRVFKGLGVKLTPEEVSDGEVCSMGNRPGPSFGPGMFAVGGSRLHPQMGQALKAMNMFAPLLSIPEGPTAIADCLMLEIEEIKKQLKAGQKLMDVFIGTPVRRDLVAELSEIIKRELPVEGEVNCFDTVCTLLLCRYGEYALFYWIEDGFDDGFVPEATQSTTEENPAS